MDATPLTERLVEVSLARARQGGLRPPAARALFDFWACLVAGVETESRSWPLGRAGRVALAAHRRDQDDLHLPTLTHPGGVVWSAVTACAVERPVTLRAAMEAAAFGYELTVRLAAAFGAEHRRRWHVTATAGTVGAAGAAALLLAGDDGGAVDAVGHALSVAGGSVQAMAELSGSRFLHRAHAADTGVACAHAACAGLTASRLGLEGGRGAFAPPPESLANDLLACRDRSAIEETGFRLYASNGFAHAALEAALALGALDAAEIEQVEVETGPAAAAIASNPSPANAHEAWWSIEHAVATCLVTGAAPEPPGGSSGPVGVADLRRRVHVTAAGADWAARVAVVLRDGTVRTASLDGPRGHGARPASTADLLAKWRRLTGSDGTAFLERLESGDDSTPFAEVIGDARGPVDVLS
jgi:2-methylcitrate dehydratase PrpD